MDNYYPRRNSNSSYQQRRFNNFREPNDQPEYNSSYRNQLDRREHYYQNNRRNFSQHHKTGERNFRRQNDSPYQRPSKFNPKFDSPRDRRRDYNTENDIVIPQSPLDIKIERLINAVKGQNGISGQIILMGPSHENENAVNLLTNAVASTNFVLNINLDERTNVCELTANNERLAETKNMAGKKILKPILFEIACNDLKRKCFYITSKQNIEEVTTGANVSDQTEQQNSDTQPTNAMEGSKAYLMMLKMGWGGKGLGANEQGEEKTVAEKITQNITKEGLGNANVMTEVENILKEFAHSLKVTTLAFDSSFSKDERAFIHKLAQKFNLKSKSVGKDENRRITISKKIEKWDLVKTLLREEGLENEAYKLLIPEDFKQLWKD